MQTTLQRIFGYSQFRPDQGTVISAVPGLRAAPEFEAWPQKMGICAAIEVSGAPQRPGNH